MIRMSTRWALVLLLVGVGRLNVMAQDTPQAQGVPAGSGDGSSADTVPEWVKNIKINGDLRYRYEAVDDDSVADEVERHRIRARLGITGKVNDNTQYGFALASGSSSAAYSTNQNLEDAFSKKDIWLDLAYFDYTVPSVEGLNLFGGKFKYPFFRPGTSDLMFDLDVNPEGLGGTYKRAINEQIDFFSAFGGHAVEERSTAAETTLWAVQAGVTVQLPQIEGGSITAGAGYFDYENIENQVALGTDATNFRGNNSSGTGYASDFNIFEFFGRGDFTVAGRPCMAFGELVKNEGAAGSDDTGYLIGAGIGKCKDPGSWQFVYNYRDLEADSLIGALTEVTFGGGGTDVKGHKFSLGHQLAKNIKLAANLMDAERTRSGSTKDHQVLQLELNFKF